MLLAEALATDRVALLTGSEEGVEPAAARRFGEFVRRRLRREPVAYILGRKGFRRIELAVDRRVLIPRPETELLVEVALELEPASLLDVGTGSGAIALAVADELEECAVHGVDTSAGAIDVARSNAKRLDMGGEGGSTFEVVAPSFAYGETRRQDLVVANLPYVPDEDWAALPPEIRDYEPQEALLGGSDGLDHIRHPPRCSSTVRRDRPRGWDGPGAGGGAPRGERRLHRHRAPSRPRGHRARRDRQTLTERVSIERDGSAAAVSALERTIQSGGVAVFPADGLYGLACDPLNAAAIERIHAIKGRDDGKPSAVMYFSALIMRELLGELGEGASAAVAALMPGPVTLVVANPSHRYPLACREDRERLGVRLIDGPLSGATCPIFQTSANRSGAPAPASFAEVPPELVDDTDLAIDGGALTGLPSTVIDITAIDAEGGFRVLREGGLPRADAERLLAPISSAAR